MNKTFRRITVIALAVVMVLSLSATAFAGTVTKNQAVNRALKDCKLKKSQIMWLEVDRDDGMYEIDFIRKSNRAEYTFEISRTGKILEKNVEYRYTHNYSKKKIGYTKARKKVASFSGIKYKTVKKGTCVYYRDDGERFYRVVFRNGKNLYEYKVLAPTGKIVEFERISY